MISSKWLFLTPQESTISLRACVGLWIPTVILMQDLQHTIVLENCSAQVKSERNLLLTFHQHLFSLQGFHFSKYPGICLLKREHFFHIKPPVSRGTVILTSAAKQLWEISTPFSSLSYHSCTTDVIYHFFRCGNTAVCLAMLVNQKTKQSRLKVALWNKGPFLTQAIAAVCFYFRLKQLSQHNSVELKNFLEWLHFLN